MTNKQTPPDWVLIEAFKRSGWDYTGPADLSSAYDRNAAFRALCDIILETKAPPVDRKLLCAREACAEWMHKAGCPESAAQHRSGEYDKDDPEQTIALRAIELWEEGFGK